MSKLLPILTAGLLGVAVTALLGFVLIPFLHRVKCGQVILDIGPRWHKNKEGTPTMGGFMFIIGIITAAVVGLLLFSKDGEEAALSTSLNIRFIAGIVMACGYSFIGFIDDYIKVVKKQNLGLTELQKLFMQIIVAAVYLLVLYLAGDRTTWFWIPFIGTFDFGFFYYPIAVFIMVGVANAVNIVDGIDGLCGSVTFVSAIGFMICAFMLGNGRMNILAVALAGGCIGFLIWNIHPAKIFMGDTGSMFLGGLLLALAFGMNVPILLIWFGLVYFLDTLSDIIQVTSIKSRHKKVFKMAPIHHHFEMSGWSENKVVIVFSLVELLGVGIGILALALR